MIDVELNVAVVKVELWRRADELRDALEARIRDKLTGQVLQTRSGALTGSITSAIADEGAAVSTVVSSVGAPYAAILEFGGKTAAHNIIAVKAKSLAIGAGGGQAFARSVRHPGSTFPARSYLGAALSEMREEIGSGLKQAVLASLGQL
jgi:phage gpG-like protein